MGNTFSCQKELTIMPVPSLNKTCHKLIEWAEPLLTQKEQTRDRKSTRLNSSHRQQSRMPSSA